MTKEIPLSQGYVAIVDDCDYERIAAFRWFVDIEKRKDGSLYCRAKRHSKTADGKPTTICMHRDVLQCGPKQAVDHIDRNPLNNTRPNLRVATFSLNNANRINPTPKSGYRGVHINRGKFVARISCNNKYLPLGRYETPEEAARAYDDAARRIQGAFAILNFPAETRSAA